MRIGKTARWAVGLALVATLAGVPAAAAGAPARSPEPRSGGAGFWAWLTAVIPRQMVQAVCDDGTHMDPDGRCRAATTTSDPPPSADDSWHMDPNG
jgi:hypothetical protein